MRVLVIGGGGYYGAQVVQVLKEGGHEVMVGSRQGAVRIDVQDRATLGVLRDFDAVVNCADSVRAPADEAVRFILAEGGLWLETSADMATYTRLRALGEAMETPVVGSVILGVGLFPGLSTLLAAQVARQAQPCRRLDLVVDFSPLSAAGKGTCALMAESLFVPAVRIEGGERVEAKGAAGEGATIDGRRATQTALPDLDLLAAAWSGMEEKERSIATWFALRPRWLGWNMRVLATFARWLRPFRRVVTKLLTWQMVLLRGWLLRRRSTTVELVAVANRGQPNAVAERLVFEDGQGATARAVAGTLRCLATKERVAGLAGVAERLTLEEVMAELGVTT